MADKQKTIQWADRQGVRVISFVETEIGISYDTETLTAEFDESVQGLDKPKVLLNLDNVSYIASRAIGCLIAFHRQVWQAGGHVVLCNVPEYVMETLRAAKLHHLFEIFETEDAALETLR